MSSKAFSPNEFAKYNIKISKDGVRRNGLDILKYKSINLESLRSIYELENYFESGLGGAIETEYHYSGYFKKQGSRH